MGLIPNGYGVEWVHHDPAQNAAEAANSKVYSLGEEKKEQVSEPKSMVRRRLSQLDRV